MDARTGFFDNKLQMLELKNDIFLQSSTGYEARLSQAMIDINKGTVTSNEHVDVKLLNGTLVADGLRILNSGEIVRFEGNVVMNLVMDQPEAPPAEPEPPRTRSVGGNKPGGAKWLKFMIDDALSLHPNYINVLGYQAGDALAFIREQPALFSRGLREMGYRLVPTRVTYPSLIRAGEPFTVKIT